MKNQEIAQPVNTRLLALFVILSISIGGISGIVAPAMPDVTRLLIVMAGVLAIIITLVKIEWGFLVLVFVTYTRFSEVATTAHGAPSTTQPLVILISTMILVNTAFNRRMPHGWQRPVVYLGIFGLVGFTSYFYARDPVRVQRASLEFLQDALIPMITGLLLKRGFTLRRVIWVLLGAGIFLGTLSVYQQLTGNFSNDYWGFAQTSLANIAGETEGLRISGPFDNPNVYAYLIVALVPLAMDRFWNESLRVLRLLAVWALMVCVLTIFFTFSRGGFLILIIAVGVMLLRHPPSLPALLLTVALATLLSQFLPNNYAERLTTLLDFTSGNGTEIQNEGSFRGRLSENTVGFLLFVDHPLLGVGLDNYPVYYLEYSSVLGIDPRLENRSAHNMYLEVASELGVIGLAAFGAIIWAMFRGMYRARRELLSVNQKDFANLVGSFSISIFALLASGLFRGLNHPSFFWLLVGIALAIPQVAKNELKAQRKQLDLANSNIAQLIASE